MSRASEVILGVAPPPKEQRPKCLSCGRVLIPIFHSEWETYHTEKTLTKEEHEAESARGMAGKMRVSSYKLDTMRGLYVEAFTGQQQVGKRWTGKYGRYGDGFFCGLNHAHQWAVAVATRLAAEGRQLLLKPSS